MTSSSGIPTRRSFLGGMLLVGACATYPASAAGPGSGSGSGRGGGAGAGRAITDPRSYRLQPEAGLAPSRPGASTTVVSTLDSPRGREIALTFDDGPDPVYTPRVLEILDRYGVPATFCVIGKNAAAYPKILYAMAESGHRIANHSWSHPQLTKLPAREARKQLARTSKAIHKAVGAPPTLARAPFGAWNKETLAISADLGMSPLGWSVDTNDWQRPGVAKIVSTVVDNAVPGSIVLCHDGGSVNSQTIDALRNYLPRLLDSGWRPVLPPSRPNEMAL